MKQAENLFKRGLSLALSAVLAASLCLTAPPARAEEGHIHSRACFLLCTEEHTHTEDCEFGGEPVCGLEEGQSHTHNTDGYFCQSVVICEPVPAEEPPAQLPEEAEPVSPETPEQLPPAQEEPAPDLEPAPEPEPIPEPEPDPVPEMPEETDEAEDGEPEPAPEIPDEETPEDGSETAIDDTEVPAGNAPPHVCPEGYWDVEYVRCWYAEEEVLAAEETADGEVSSWDELKAAAEAGGVVVLAGDIVSTEQLVIPAGTTTVIDLNGYSLRGTMPTNTTNFIVVKGELTIRAYSNEDKIVCINGDNAISVSADGVLRLENGTITTTNSNRAIFVNGAMYMSGGSIVDNGFSSLEKGGGVFVNGGHFEITGGEISRNTAQNGGGIYVQSNGTVVVGGDVHIFRNTATVAGGGICVASGSANVGGSAYINANTAPGEEENVNVCGNIQIDPNSDCIVEGRTELDPEDSSGLKKKLDENDLVILEENYTLTGKIIISDNKQRTLDLNGHTITTASRFLSGDGTCMFLVKGLNSRLTIIDSALNGNISSEVENLDSLIQVEDGGTLEIKAGTFTNTNGYRAVTVNGGTVNMSGGTLTGVKNGSNGAGIMVHNEGTLNMTGGEISGNICKNYGGGVRVSGGTANISGGTISNNKTEIDGGGISVNKGTLTISGGTIENNTANRAGGGICSGTESTLYIQENAKITGNKATRGGGVCTAKLEMSGGEITNNTAERLANDGKSGGGGIYVMNISAVGTDENGDHELVVTGGSISSNRSDYTGGGIFIDIGATGVVNGEKNHVYIKNNRAEDTGYKYGDTSSTGHGFAGGGIFVEHNDYAAVGQAKEGGVLYVYDAVISKNRAYYGGGVAGCGSSSVQVFSVRGVAIYDNELTSNETNDWHNWSVDLYCDGEGEVDSYMLGGFHTSWEGKASSGVTPVNNGSEKLEDFYLKSNVPGDVDKEKIENIARVFIQENTSASNGGGIGGNGFIKLGLEPGKPSTPDDPDAPGSSTPTGKTGSLTVKKSWNDAGHEASRPESVAVQLLQSGEPYGQAVTLTADSWTHTWTDLPLADEAGNPYVYSVEELTPGERYTVKYSSESVSLTADGSQEITVTNTYAPPGTPQDPPKEEPPKEEPKDPPKDPPKEDPKDPPKNPPKEDPKDPPKEEVKDPPKEEPPKEEDPPSEEPPEEEPPRTPPEEPEAPEEPEESEERREPEYPTELPDPNDPDSPERITIWEDGVPLTYMKVWDPVEEEYLYILEDEVPLFGFDVPETGDESWTGLWAALCLTGLGGAAAVASGRKREDEDETA